MSFLSRSWVLAALVLSLGCSSNDEAGPEPSDLQTFGAAFADAQCSTIFTCCTQDEVDTVFTGVDVADQDACRSAVEGQTRVFLVPSLEASIEAERLTLTSSAKEGCLEALRSRPCANFTPGVSVDLFELEACRAFLQARLELSEFCREDWECKTGFCSIVAGEEEGTCKAPARDGEPCLNGLCAAGLFCAEAEETCQPRLEAGEPCARNGECASDNCVEDAQDGRICGEAPLFCEGGA